ncbi:MAG: FkbM family methyltransferase [Bacteroidota bacterium]
MNLKTRLDNRYKKFVFNLIASESSIFNLYHKYFYTPKENSLACFLNNYSKANAGLTVVQIGANDGYNRDPYVKFIKRDKWKGILVEPQPYVFETYLKKLYRKSNLIIPYNCAIDNSNGTRNMYKLSFSNARWATGLTTFDRDVLEKAIDSGHVAGHAQKSGIELPQNRQDYITEEAIETITPESLLKKHNISNVDLLAIDTEGYDFEVIKMFNVPKLKPRVIVYENMILSDKDKKEAATFLEEAGYLTRNIKKDTVAILRGDKDINTLSDCFNENNV